MSVNKFFLVRDTHGTFMIWPIARVLRHRAAAERYGVPPAISEILEFDSSVQTADDLQRLFSCAPTALTDMARDQTEEAELKCTCDEFSKQRAICPVCDKADYEKMEDFSRRALQDLQPAKEPIPEAVQTVIQAFGDKYFPCTCGKETEGRHKHFSGCPKNSNWEEALEEFYRQVDWPHEEIQRLICTVLSETAAGMEEWMQNEMVVKDLDGNLLPLHVEANHKSSASYIFPRLEKHGIILKKAQP
jgi:hypothetical protein